MRQIVIDKSIKRKRVVYKLKAGLIFDYVMMYFLAWVLPVISVKLIFFSPKQAFNPVELLFILLDVWLLISLYLMNKLIILEGKTFDINRKAIMNILTDTYPDIAFASGNPNLIRGQKEVGYSRERIVSIILNEENIYINILNTYRGNGFSFFHGLTNYLKSKKLANNFKLTIFNL